MPSLLSVAQRRLTIARARRRRQALGPPLALDAAHLDALADVGPPDVAEAEAFARDMAGQVAVDLMRARRG